MKRAKGSIMWAGCRARVRLLGAVCLLFPLCGGCRNTSAELLESELRTRDIQFREALDELKRTESHNEALQRELHSMRQGGINPISPEHAAQTFALKRIALGR